VLDALPLPLRVEGHNLHVTASIGVSVYPEDGATGELLLKHADTAIYHAKEQGRSGFQCYTREMGIEPHERGAARRAGQCDRARTI
jgi:diguanylate cyclase (GGDEF)-like protein